MSRALEFFRKTAAQNSEVQRSGATQAGEKNNLIRAPERLKSSPSSPSYPRPQAPVLTVAGPAGTPEEHPGRLEPSLHCSPMEQLPGGVPGAAVVTIRGEGCFPK